MNFDDIQSLWNADDGRKGKAVPDKVEKIRAAHHPVDRIRRAMRREGWLQLWVLVLAGLYGHVMSTPVRSVAYYCLYGVTLACCGYYAWRFYRFYRRLGTAVLSTREHLYEVYYDIRLHIEIYRSLTYAQMMLVFGFVMLYMAPELTAGAAANGWSVFRIAAVFIVLMAWVVIATEMRLKWYYGKYLNEIKMIKDELKEDI
jgi:hypothetical protein